MDHHSFYLQLYVQRVRIINIQIQRQLAIDLLLTANEMLAANVSVRSRIVVLPVDRRKPQSSLYGVLWKSIEADSLLLGFLRRSVSAKRRAA